MWGLFKSGFVLVLSNCIVTLQRTAVTRLGMEKITEGMAGHEEVEAGSILMAEVRCLD